MTLTTTAPPHHALVDLFASLADGPMAVHTSSGTERMALVALSVANARGRNLTMGQLASRVGLSRAAMTALCDRLTDRGLMKRVPSKQDRRRVDLGRTDMRSPRLIYALVVDVRERAGIHATCHAFRRAYATLYLRQNPGQIETLAHLMAHESIATTQRYLDDVKKEDAMQTVVHLNFNPPSPDQLKEAA